MPTIKSAEKRVRTSEKARKRNKSIKTSITSARRKALAAFDAKNAETGAAAFRSYCSTLDKAAKKGVICKNTAIRRKRRAAAKLATLLPQPSQPVSATGQP